MDKSSYKQIFKSTGIIGGSQVLKIIIGIFRTKMVAILLGPAGIGLDGIFQSIIELMKNATGFGINFSGVKSIAEDNDCTDTHRVERTILVLRRWAIGTGLLGMILTIILCQPFSDYSFGNTSNAGDIALLSIVILFSSISGGQLALLQGLRMIRQMAKATLIGAVVGSAIVLPVYWWLGIKGVVPGLILNSLGSLGISWLYSRNISAGETKLSFVQTFKSGIGMARLGFFIVINGFIATLGMYAIRALIRSHLGIDSVGFFQAVWTLSTFYIGILLNAMLADYFPRLSMIHNDKDNSNKLINEQLEITLLVGAPMLLGMIVFAPIVLNILYSSSFHVAAPILKWQMAASFFTLVSWPLGVLYLSKNKGAHAVLFETLRQAIYISIIFLAWDYIGFNVLGIGFFIANFVNLVFVVFNIRRINSFHFTGTNLRYISIFGCIVMLVLACSLYLEGSMQYYICISILILVCLFCLYELDKLIDIRRWIKIPGFSSDNVKDKNQ